MQNDLSCYPVGPSKQDSDETLHVQRLGNWIVSPTSWLNSWMVQNLLYLFFSSFILCFLGWILFDIDELNLILGAPKQTVWSHATFENTVGFFSLSLNK